MHFTMNPQHFREVPLSECEKKHDDPNGRLSMDAYESGLIVQAYTTNRFLRSGGIDEEPKAINFTAEIEVTDRSAQKEMGIIGIRFYVLSGLDLTFLPNVERTAIVYPEPPGNNEEITEWSIVDGWPLFYPTWNKKLKHGFFTHTIENDLSKLYDPPKASGF